MNLHEWALRWKLPGQAIYELQMLTGANTPPLPEKDRAHGKSEAFAQSQVMLEASQKGIRLWRNNVGALKDDNGRVVRYGLANDSESINKIIKSGDLIGWRTFIITQDHVGRKVAQFVSREVKAPGWQFTGQDREAAQKTWADMILADGGDAAFATGPGTL